MFERFKRIRDGTASPADRDGYARALMKLVSLTFIRKGYIASLPQVGIDPEDAAASNAQQREHHPAAAGVAR